MSEIIATEWFDKKGTGVATQTIGIVLSYDDVVENYKAWIGIGFGLDPKIDAELIHTVGCKISFKMADSLFHEVIKGHHIRMNLHESGDHLKMINYDGMKYEL